MSLYVLFRCLTYCYYFWQLSDDYDIFKLNVDDSADSAYLGSGAFECNSLAPIYIKKINSSIGLKA